MPSDPSSVAQALQLGWFVPAAYDLFAQDNLAAFAAPDGLFYRRRCGLQSRRIHRQVWHGRDIAIRGTAYQL
jgi:hypothetical protein